MCKTAKYEQDRTTGDEVTPHTIFSEMVKICKHCTVLCVTVHIASVSVVHEGILL